MRTLRIADGAGRLDIVLDLDAASVWPRVRRTKTGVAVTPMAIMALLERGPEKGRERDGEDEEGARQAWRR